VEDLLRRVDPHRRANRLHAAVPCLRVHGDLAPALEAALEERLEPDDVVDLLAGEAEGRRALAGAELERQDAHPDEVRAVDPLVALGEDGADAEEPGPLRRPVTRRARAVLLAGDDDEGDAFLEVPDRRVEDGHRVARGEVTRDAALGAGGEL